MSLEDALDTLLSDTTPALRAALRRAYELGFREALAGAAASAPPRTPPPAPAPAPPPTPPPPPTDEEDLEPEDAPPSAVGRELGVEAGVEVGGAAEELPSSPGLDWSAVEDPGASRSAPRHARPIFPHATIGTLRQRIVALFDLGRFDIDVVICRKGDRARRQLKQTVKLGKYLVEG
jgi:hypothetical protein